MPKRSSRGIRMNQTGKQGWRKRDGKKGGQGNDAAGGRAHVRQHHHEPSCALFYRGPHLAGGWEQLPGPTVLSHRPVVWHLAQPRHEHPAASPPAGGLTSPACGSWCRVFAFHLLACFDRGRSRRRRAHGFLPPRCAAAPGRASRPVPGPAALGPPRCHHRGGKRSWHSPGAVTLARPGQDPAP